MCYSLLRQGRRRRYGLSPLPGPCSVRAAALYFCPKRPLYTLHGVLIVLLARGVLCAGTAHLDTLSSVLFLSVHLCTMLAYASPWCTSPQPDCFPIGSPATARPVWRPDETLLLVRPVRSPFQTHGVYERGGPASEVQGGSRPGESSSGVSVRASHKTVRIAALGLWSEV